jgi:hypothetical protein
MATLTLANSKNTAFEKVEMSNYSGLNINARINLRGNLKRLEFQSKELYAVAGAFCNRSYLANFIYKHSNPIWF